jgi:signal transduction histidine kinase
MIDLRVSQFKLVLVLSVTLALSIATYFVWAMADFNSQHAFSESQFLSKFTERAISHYSVDPHYFLSKGNKRITGTRVDLVVGYDQLKLYFPFIPDEKNFVANKAKAVLIKYRGLFKVPDYLLIKPVFVDGTQFYGYLLVDEKLNDTGLDLRAFQKIQPAIFILLFCIFVLVIVELFHISKVNSSINEFAQWANQLNAGKDLTPMPSFSSSKFNYLAFAIDKSLSGMTEMLVQEQSFAKFTSHELRTPIAVLSANMELLELLMKDLSPQERAVLKNMESAVMDMKYQMEALLWLSREDERNMDYTLCSLRSLVDKALQDNSYLAVGKSVGCHVIGDDIFVNSNTVFIQIILNNLVRNAYQNTESGRIEVMLENNTITIFNENDTETQLTKNDVGFGIGLTLVARLVRKLGIGYNLEKNSRGHKIKLTF